MPWKLFGRRLKNTMIKMNKLVILLLLFVISFQLTAQEKKDKPVYPQKAAINKEYLKSYYYDGRDMLLSPLSWTWKEWSIAGATIGGAFAIMTQDQKIRDFAQDNVTEQTILISDHFLEPWGSGVYSIPTMGLFYLGGMAFKSERAKKTALLGVKAFILSGAAVQVPKYLLNRQRPQKKNPSDPYQFNGVFYGKFSKSMPSGHTTSIWTVATVVAEEYKSTIYVPVLCYSIAALSGLSRIHDDKHWGSDVFVGAVFGWAMGKLIHNYNNWGVQIEPYTYSEGVGASIIFPLASK
jgi:membrane-associated phospholipid phosphatase